jgi:hypothetical protein
MKNVVPGRVVRFSDDGNPILVPHSSWSASIDLDEGTIELKNPTVGAVKMEFIDLDGFIEIIEEKEEVDIVSTLGKLALVGIAAHAMAKGASHLAHQPTYDSQTGLSSSDQSSAGAGEFGAGAALLSLGTSGAVKRGVIKGRLHLIDTTSIDFEATTDELANLLVDFPSDGAALERFRNWFQLLDRRIADGARGLPELENDILLLQERRLALIKSLEQAETFEARDNIRQQSGELFSQIESQKLAKGIVTFYLAYDQAERENKLVEQVTVDPEPSTVRRTFPTGFAIAVAIAVVVGVVLLRPTAPTATKYPDFPSTTTIEELRAARASQGVNYDPWIVSLRTYDDVDKVKLALSELESMNAPVFIGHFTMPRVQKTTVYAGPYSSQEDALTACQSMKNLGGGFCKMNVGRLSAFNENN